MIVTDSILQGYTVINGSWGLQLALLIAIILEVETKHAVGLTSELAAEIEFVKILLMALHAFLTIVAFIGNNPKVTYEGLKGAINQIGMAVYVYVILMTSNIVLNTPPLS